jgi:hypothetical protein
VIPVPAEWLAAASTTHQPQWRAVAVRGNHTQNIPFTSLDVSKVSGRSWPRTRATITWPADPVPALVPDVVKPYGSQLLLSFRPNPGEAWCRIATLYITQTTLSRPQGQWKAEAVDGSGMIDEDNILAAFPWTPSGSIGDAATSLIHRTFPTAAVNVDPAAAAALSASVPQKFDAAQDRRSPWDLVETLTDLVGCEAHILPDGSYLLRRIPQLQELSGAVDRLAVEDNIESYEVILNSAWNTVVLEFEDRGGSGQKVSGVWQDTRPDSPLAVGNLGRRITYWEAREGAPSKAQADTAALVLGERAAGAARGLSVTVVNRPWLEPGDTVAVTYAGGPADEPMQITFLEHSGDAHTTRIGLRNWRYISALEV